MCGGFFITDFNSFSLHVARFTVEKSKNDAIL